MQSDLQYLTLKYGIIRFWNSMLLGRVFRANALIPSFCLWRDFGSEERTQGADCYGGMSLRELESLSWQRQCKSQFISFGGPRLPNFPCMSLG